MVALVLALSLGAVEARADAVSRVGDVGAILRERYSTAWWPSR